METTRALTGLMFAAVLACPVTIAQAAPESAPAPNAIMGMTDDIPADELNNRFAAVEEALASGDARALHSALSKLTGRDEISDEQAKKIAQRLRKLKTSHSDHAERLEQAAWSAENLTIGRIAPNIVGKDTKGVEFELKDYRGKVVVVDFWGDW